MFDRIFQDSEGTIKELSGKTILSLSSIEDAISGDVYLLWFKVAPDMNWYRVFIDGWYCGVDKYRVCNLKDDIDDDVVVHDLTEKYKNQIIKAADIQEPREENRYIVFSLRLDSFTAELVNRSENGNCHMATYAS